MKCENTKPQSDSWSLEKFIATMVKTGIEENGEGEDGLGGCRELQ